MRRVAITGVGVVGALGDGLAAHLEAFAAGRGGIGPIGRFDASGLEARTAAEAAVVPREDPVEEAAAVRDVKIGFALRAADQALAGFDGLGGDWLVHLGTAAECIDPQDVVVDGRVDLAAAIDRRLAGESAVMRLPYDTAPRLIERAHGRAGELLVNVAACAASAQAVGQAFHHIRAGRYGRALCGGFDSLINLLGIGGMQKLGALSVDNEAGARSCRPFDIKRCGTTLGEGAACFVLEDLDAARAEGRPVLAELRGYGTSLDAHSPSAPDPAGDGARRAMLSALADAGLAPGDIAHVNAHGTGTYLNDEVEAKAIRAVFADTWETSLPVSAVKGLCGHCIAAAGAMELVSCLVPLLRGVLPPNPHLTRPGIDCELDHVTAPGRPFTGRWLMTNSFGFGGQNACLVVGRPDGG